MTWHTSSSECVALWTTGKPLGKLRSFKGRPSYKGGIKEHAAR